MLHFTCMDSTVTSITLHVAQLQWNTKLQGLFKKLTTELRSSCGRQTENQ